MTQAKVTSISVSELCDVISKPISREVVVASTAIDAERFCSVSVDDTGITSPALVPLTRSWMLQVPEVDLAATASIRTFCLNARVTFLTPLDTEPEA